MKTVWLWTFSVALLACSSPEEGGIRRNNDANSPSEGGPDAGMSGGVRCGGAVCDPNASCTKDGDDERCVCADGFEGSGKECSDVDECADGELNDCDPNANCINRDGTYACRCKPGFLGDGKECEDTDQCDGAANTCDPNAICLDDDDGFDCECGPGYTGDGFGCGDVDECDDESSFSCGANAECENSFGGYTCKCAPGFSGDGDSCSSWCDVAKDDSSVCDSDGLCRAIGTEGVCDACAPGYAGNGKSCSASEDCDDECDGNGDDADNAVCGEDGSCSCAPGFSGSPGSCRDIDECDDADICGPNSTCANVEGGYVCSCKAGYEADDDGECVDVDECDRSPSPCHPDATCTNTTPEESDLGYECECDEGFTGDGTICTDIDECKDDNGGCAENDTCVNERGSSTCECQAPLVGEPGKCHCDLSGIWAMRSDLDTCWADRPIQEGATEVIVSAGSVEAYVWEIRELEYDGETIRIRRSGCGEDNEPDLVSPLFRETYSSFIPFETYDGLELQDSGSYEQEGIVPGSSFTTPREVSGGGIELGDDLLSAEWPAPGDVTAEQWEDADGDGEPGLTLWSHVPSEKTDSGSSSYSYLPARPGVGQDDELVILERAACISIALRVVTHLEMEVESCTHIVGKVINEKSEGRVHSCILADKGECTSDAVCSGWKEDYTCKAEDWEAARKCADEDDDGTPDCMCNAEDIERLDDDQNQEQNTRATFELLKIGDIGDDLSCVDVREALPAKPRRAPTITCTTPE